MLKQLKLSAELKQRNSELEKLNETKKGFEQRKQNLELALREAVTDEEIELVSSQIGELETETEKEDIDTKIEGVAGKIEEIERELEDIGKATSTEPTKIKEEKRGNDMNKYQIREMLKTGEYYERSEVKGFYEKFKNLRAVGGEGLTIPNIVVNRIMTILGDFSTLYPLVDKIKVKGTTRILIDTDTTPATWIEQTGTIPQGEVGTITNIDFDGWKVGKVTFVDNSMLEDSIINLDEYVCRKIARSIAIALDKAILAGTGATGKQPEGIIPKLEADHKVITVADPKLADIMKFLGLIDTGEDSTGEIVSVMKRSTYYNRLLGYTINTDSSGNVVGKLPNVKNPDLLGLSVVFNNNMDDDKILFGDFLKYTLVERESIVVDKSEHVKFSEDQMGFRGKGRFDGKPTNKKAFVLVTLNYTPEA